MKATCKILFFLFALFFPFLILNFIYKKAEFEHGDSDVSKFFNVPQEIELANLGSSHGKYSFDYSKHPELNAFNFALPLQPLDFDYRIAKQYINNMQKKSVLMVVVSWFEIDAVPTDSNYQETEKKYYQFLKRNLLKDKSFGKYLKLKYFPIAASSHPFRTIKNQLIVPFFSNQKKNSRDANSVEKNFAAQTSFKDWTEEKQNIEAKEAAEGIFRKFERKGSEGLSYNENLIEKIIALCKENDVKPVIVTTPFTENLNSFVDKNQTLSQNISRFKQYVSQNHPDVPWLDYSHNSDFSTHLEYFGDPSHMLDIGALHFTDKVISDLRSLNLLEN